MADIRVTQNRFVSLAFVEINQSIWSITIVVRQSIVTTCTQRVLCPVTRDRLFVVCFWFFRGKSKERRKAGWRNILFFWSVFCLFVFFSGFVLEARNVEGSKPARRRYLLREKEPLGNVKLPQFSHHFCSLPAAVAAAITYPFAHCYYYSMWVL